jgi:hypothetical protein
MLPSDIPNARIMVFNYESKWHAAAPKQRRYLCGEQLLTALDNRRKEVILRGLIFGGIILKTSTGNTYHASTSYFHWT